ncbi:MAG TPA: macro domain-containing protein [Vicinamibacterales bacterium]|nr:macro domain-containing protein [Vicinamibacterales bacterium]
MILEFVQGDITDQSTDAIVNAANDHFWMGGGVAGAIRLRGGERIEAEAMAQGPVQPGDCVITGAGRLPAKHVIHAAVMGQDLQTSASIIETATRNALALAEAHALESIALPAFGTGVGGFPVDECAKIMIDAVLAHQAASLRLVRFVLFGERAYNAFVQTSRRH